MQKAAAGRFRGLDVECFRPCPMPANPRQSCIRALLEWEKGKHFSDEILHTALDRERFAPLDRAFLMETFFGVRRNLSRLDFLIGRLRDGHIDPETRAILRLGLYQIFHMRTAAHAAVTPRRSPTPRAVPPAGAASSGRVPAAPPRNTARGAAPRPCHQACARNADRGLALQRALDTDPPHPLDGGDARLRGPGDLRIVPASFGGPECRPKAGCARGTGRAHWPGHCASPLPSLHD